METYRVPQEKRQCVLHRVHHPITVTNEEHHVFPQEWQIDLWGKVMDKETWPICATGHNTVHTAIKFYKKNGKWPRYCRAKTKELAMLAIQRYESAKSQA